MTSKGTYVRKYSDEEMEFQRFDRHCEAHKQMEHDHLNWWQRNKLRKKAGKPLQDPETAPRAIWKKEYQKRFDAWRISRQKHGNEHVEVENLKEAADPKRLYNQMKAAHLEYLEKLSGTWALSLERKKLMDAGQGHSARVEELDLRQASMVVEAERMLKKAYYCRVARYNTFRQSETFRQEEMRICRHDFIHWINWWCFTEDPRLLALKLPAQIPMILWPVQEEMLREFDYCYSKRISCLVEKSREMGATWMFMCYGLHKFIFEPGFKMVLGSRKENLVDQLGNPDTLFSKMRYLMYRLPPEMRPKTFDKQDGPNDKLMLMTNPDNGASLVGECGDDIGRGGRSSLAFVDEYAFLDHPEKVDRALSLNTNCQVDVSTYNGPNLFYKKRKEGGVKVFTLWWYKDPSKNPDWRSGTRPAYNDWYEYQKLKFAHDPAGLAREVDMDPNASNENAFIDAKWVRAAINFPLRPEGERVAGFDIAGGGSNESVYTLRVGPVALAPQAFRYKSSTEACWKAIELGKKDRIGVLNFDADGGFGDTLKAKIGDEEDPLPYVLNGIHGNDAASVEEVDDEQRPANKRFRNKRAELWWNVRERFRKTFEHVNGVKLYSADELISIVDDPVLIAQLSAPRDKPTASGKRAVESKQEMKSRGVDSPDRADSLVYAFAEYDTGARVVSEFDYTANARHYVNFDVQWTRAGSEGYAVIVQTPDLTVHALCCLWWPGAGKLQVCREFVFPNADPAVVVTTLKDAMQAEVRPVKEWIANDEMFAAVPGRTAPWFLYRKAGVSLKRNYSNDYYGAIMLANQMFAKNAAQVHTRCRDLMLQLAHWGKTRSGTPSDNLGLAMAFCQLVTRLRRKKAIDPKKINCKYGDKPFFADTAKDDHTVSNYIKARSAM